MDDDLEQRVRRLEAALAELEARVHAGAFLPSPAAVGADEQGARDERDETEARDLEARLGTDWLARAGILALITGLAWFVVIRFERLGPAPKVVLGYGLAGAIAAVGVWFARTQRRFGHVVLGGGLSAFYFVTYALFLVPSLRVIESVPFGLAALAVSLVVIVTSAQRLASETVAGIALFLGFHTSFLVGVDGPAGTAFGGTVLSLLSVAMLAAAAGFFLVKNRWIVVPLSSLVGVYSTHAWLVVRSVHGGLAPSLVVLGLECMYFLIFALAVLARPRQLTVRVALAFVLTNVTAFVLLGVATCERGAPELRTAFLALAAGLCAAAAFGARARRSRLLGETFAAAAVAVLTLALASGADEPWRTCAVGGLAAALFPRRRPVLTGTALAVVAFELGDHVLRGNASALPPTLLAAAFVYGTIVLRDEAGETQVASRSVGAVGAGGALVDAGLAFRLATLTWLLAAVLLVGLGLAARVRALRLAGLGVVALAGAKLLLVDFGGLSTDERVLTFVLAGALLLGLSLAYARFGSRLRSLL